MGIAGAASKRRGKGVPPSRARHPPAAPSATHLPQARNKGQHEPGTIHRLASPPEGGGEPQHQACQRFPSG
eukprot:3579245-Heterocapsa_arctica.AAC.1